ncbi:RNA polymerase sigma factor [Pelagibius sp.]|uniref:RNA polymerase sigma factor n=1 Tax=Pelagibius sp. TaxID=1931238 RepID=UPI003BAECAAB
MTDNGAVEPVTAALRMHYDELIAFVRRRVRCSALADDIVQETYVRLASTDKSAEIENPRALLYRVAGNLAIDHLRREKTRAKYVMQKPLSEEVADAQPSVEAMIDARQRVAILMQAVDELPPRCREVFVLRKFEGRHQAEIARSLGISRNMVEKHLRKALLHCALRLKARD